MKTLVASPFKDDAEEILAWAYGFEARQDFRNWVSNGQRTGQAFMNTLSKVDYPEYKRLIESDIDPFYDDKLIGKALDLLTSK